MAAAPPRRSRSLYAMLAEARLGKISVLARPATLDPGALELPTRCVHRGIRLQLAIDHDFGRARTHNVESLIYPVHLRMPCAALGGKA